MARQGEILPGLLADRAAGVLLLQQQIDAIAGALGGELPA